MQPDADGNAVLGGAHGAVAVAHARLRAAMPLHHAVDGGQRDERAADLALAISAVVGCAGALAPRPAKSSLIEMASSTSPTPARISAFCQA